MQQKSPSKGTFIALIIIVIVSLLLYFYYKGAPSDSSTSSIETVGTPESSDAQAASARVIALLNQISSLKIDPAIFNSAVYKSLVDYSITIPEQPVGRVNPFAPTAGSVVSSPAIKLPSTAR
jgi:hypothetical protein